MKHFAARPPPSLLEQVRELALLGCIGASPGLSTLTNLAMLDMQMAGIALEDEAGAFIGVACVWVRDEACAVAHVPGCLLVCCCPVCLIAILLQAVLRHACLLHWRPC